MAIYHEWIPERDDSKYFGCFVELIKYLINLYDFCAEFFLEEFSCYNTIIDYLINCPMYDIKKILVGLIHSAMQKSEQSYKDKRGNNNIKVKNETKVKEEPKLSDEELAKKLQEELNGVSKSKEADETILYKDISSPYVLKVIYNIIYIVFRKIKFYSYKNETRFLLDILHKFSLISQENRKFLVNEINISLPLNLFIGKKCQEKEYSEQEVLNIDKGLFKPAHEILNPTPGQTVLGDRDKTGNYATLDYDIMLLCSLNYFKARTKDEIKKKNEDIGFSFYSDRYILSLIRHCKTKQGIKYFYKLVLLKCLENKEIFETVVKRLIAIIDAISDIEAAFFDESDLESDAEIYKNVGENAGDDCSLKTLKKNVSFVFRKLVSDSKNDKLRDYKIKTILSKLFTYFSKNKKYYSKAITIVNILLNIFETSEIDIKKYTKELNEILNWLIKYPVPPKHYEIRGMNMYKDQPPAYHYKEMSKEQKAQFEKKEKDKTIEYLGGLPIKRSKIMTNKIIVSISYIVLMTLILGIFNYIALLISGDFNQKEYILLAITPLFIGLPLFGLNLFISMFMHKTKKTVGISLGMVFLFYIINVLSELSDKVEFLKYLSIYTLADIRGVISNTAINPINIIISLAITILFISLSYIRYDKKELI